jgi:glycosyltransferase involved in cell wall biosynthesis
MTPTRPLSILHLVSSERWTGVADPVISLASQQAASGHTVWLACIGGYTFEEKARESGVRIFTALTLDRRLHPPNLYADYRRLRQFIGDNDIDIVHTHLLHDNWLAGLALRGRQRPHLLVRTMHRFEWPRGDPFHKWLFGKRTDAMITTSESMRQRIAKRVGLPPERVDIVHGGVDLQRFNPSLDPSIVRDEFNIPPEAPVVGIVARLRDGRGHHWLLRAAPEVLAQAPEARFLIVGRGELKRDLRARIAASPHADRLVMTGYRDEDLPEAYAAMNCALFLGQGSEGTCRAILEAMACGRPVIGASVGGVRDIVEDGATGRLVEEDDCDGLADAITSLLTDTEKTANMGRNARKQCEERFTEERRASDILDIYERAWKRKHDTAL